ncbi:MAG: hypothetical protein ACI9W2_003731 [Gammaproteobacteria bacterium]|jgi:hypothetical protein
MSLADTLHAVHEAGMKRIPKDKYAVMSAATKALRESGIMDGVIKVGDRLPAFSLANRDGDVVNSADLLARGPLVLTVFRGSW